MSDIISRLRQTRANMLGTDDEPHYWDCQDAATEIAHLRLTDAERAAVLWAIGACEIEQTTASVAADRGYLLPVTREWAAKHGERAATLRGLLERMGGER